VIQRRIVFTGDSLNDEPSALGFASKPACGHAASREGDLRCIVESKRCFVINLFGWDPL